MTHEELVDVIGNLVYTGFEWGRYGCLLIYLYMDFVYNTLGVPHYQFGVNKTLAGAIFETSTSIPNSPYP